ncbi:MAG TPA: hypothetical protein VIF57_31155 [Polyangia bacterium]
MTAREHAEALVAALRACVAEGPNGRAAQARFEEAAGQVAARLLPAVDLALREKLSSYRESEFASRDLPELARFMHAPGGWAAAAVAASHRDGYVREAAVWALAAARDGRAVPYVLLRLNDWVKQIRDAARAVIEVFFQPQFAADVIAALPVAWALARRGRDDHERFISRMLAFLRSPACAPALRAGGASPDREVRRNCLELLLRRGGGAEDEAPQVLGGALADRDPMIRVWAARRLARAVPAPWAEALARRALGDRSVQVRRAALAALAPVLPDGDARPLLEAALLDANTTARWQARVLMLARGPFDLAAYYRRVLSTAAERAAIRGALLGLGESGTVADVAVVVPFLSADRARVSGAALRARAGLEPFSVTEPYLLTLRSPERSLSREARRALEPRLSFVPIAALREIVVDLALPPHARRNALLLAGGKSKWERLPALLDACADPDEVNAKLALLLVDGWNAGYNRSFVPPTRAQIDEAATAFARVSRRLGPRASVEIAHVLRALAR